MIPFKHNIPRRPQQISGEYFACGCPQMLFGVVRKIFHILHALVNIAFGIAVIHPAAELAQGFETVALSPLVDEPVDVGNDPETFLMDCRADLHRIGTA